MILYFTGTGNSAFIAKRIAEKTGDTAVDVFPMAGRSPMCWETG